MNGTSLNERPSTGRAARAKAVTLQQRQARLAWILLLPTIAVVAFVTVYPLGMTIYQSFTNQQFLGGINPTQWVGLQNYSDLLQDTTFRNSIITTIKFTAITIVFEFLLGMIIALVVNSNFRGRGVMRAAMLVPWAIPTVISSQMWKWMYNDIYGVVNDLLVRAHILTSNVAFISRPDTSLPAIAAVDIWKTTPFVALLLLAGLQVIPSDIYEAAQVDGTNALQRFWLITLPLLRPALLVTLIFRTLDALRVFDVFYVMFGNRLDTQTMAIYVQNTIVGSGQVGYGAAVSVAIFVIIAVFVVIYLTILPMEEQ